MARHPRIEFPGALYHVISRGNHGQKVFRGPEDFARYGQLLLRYQQRYKFVLYAYVLMSTHVHLLVETGESPLSKVMQGLQQSYTIYFNRRYQLSGHLFQGRYRALLCQKDAYLLELVRYLHLNPVRAGLVKTPDAYRWSSHGTYLEGQPRSGVTVARVLAQFSPTPARAISEYRKFIQAGLRQGHRPDLYQTTDRCYLGDEDFIDQIKRRVSDREPLRLVKIALPEVARVVARATGVRVEELTSPGRAHAAAEARALIAYLAQAVGGIRLTTAAAYLRRDPATVSLAVRKLQQRQAKDRALRALVRRLGEAVRKRGRGK